MRKNDMKRVEEIEEADVSYHLGGTKHMEQWNWMLQTIKQQQEQIERYEEALKYISGDVDGHVYADSFDESIQAAMQALEESE